MITGLSHVSMVVPDIEAAAKAIEQRYGLVTGARMVNEQQGVRLAYVELPGAKIELMEPSRPDSPVAKFLERNPKGGIHHFSLAAIRACACSATARAATSTATASPSSILRISSAHWSNWKSIEADRSIAPVRFVQ
jgi:methylmalonyl-CoA/ethylmalonyl-CoA epimerase